MALKTTVETATVNKMTHISLETPLSAENNRIKSNTEVPFSSDATMKIRIYYKALKKSKFPLCFCLLLYIFICLLGNIVTGILLYKQQSTSPEVEDEEEYLRTNIALPAPVNVSKEITEEEYFDLYQLFMNESKEQVSDNLINS